MLLTSVTLACVGLAVMLLLRMRTQALAPEDAKPSEGDCLVTSSEPAHEAILRPTEPLGRFAVALESAPPQAVEYAPPDGAPPAAVAPRSPEHTEVARMSSSDAELDPVHPRVSGPPQKSTSIHSATSQSLAPARGASALIAKAAQLLPRVLTPPSHESSRPRAARNPSGFQPGGRFSRSQQAFLRIPVVLAGNDEAGAEFQEESATLILLPQGAVIPMKRRVCAGDRLVMINPSRQQKVPCRVFGAHQGPDGKMLVEIEFAEPQRNFWPVSFPAWAGNGPGSAPARTPALDSHGS